MDGKAASPVMGSREVVMKYDEKEEVEATKEWLLRIKDVGFAEELTYVPSYLNKVGVAPVDVVDRLEYLRSRPGSDRRDYGKIAVAVLEKPEVVVAEEPVEEPPATEEPEALVLDVETLEERPSVHVVESAPLVFDYDSHAPWAWAEPNEKIIESALHAVLAPESGLHEFNRLAAETRERLMVKTRGRRARSAVAKKNPSYRTPETVGSNSAGASSKRELDGK